MKRGRGGTSGSAQKPQKKRRIDPEAFLAEISSSNAKKTAPVDPFDEFMSEINAMVDDKPTASKGERMGMEDEDFDGQVAQLKTRAEQGMVSRNAMPEVRKVYEDSQRTAFAPTMHADLTMAPVVKGSVKYEPFNKIHPELEAMTRAEILEFRVKNEIHVNDSRAPTLVSGYLLSNGCRPIQRFGHARFPAPLLAAIAKAGFTIPTPIQSQAIPTIMAGFDLVGVAKTGSGKTLAFVWPMLQHIVDQRPLSRGEGPIGVILAPTRELGNQIYTETKRFAKVFKLRCAQLLGGTSKWEQCKKLKSGVEIVVATPGRLIDILKMKATNLRRVTYMVVDEADKMFQVGFEAQLRTVVGQCRPDRQTVLFSATFRPRVRQLVSSILHSPVNVSIGVSGQSNADVNQIVYVMAGPAEKWSWLCEELPGFIDEGKVLIFVSSKLGAENLRNNLQQLGHRYIRDLHGDHRQEERDAAMKSFKTGTLRVLIATDVASRGLDVQDVRVVVNFDVAKNIDTHVHRVGRTGRMGVDGVVPGTAYTLVSKKETRFAGELVKNLQLSNQVVPPELLALAMTNPKFRHGKRGGNQAPRFGLGSGPPSPTPPQADLVWGRERRQRVEPAEASIPMWKRRPVGSSGAVPSLQQPPSVAGRPEPKSGLEMSFVRASKDPILGGNPAPPEETKPKRKTRWDKKEAPTSTTLKIRY